MLDPLYVFFVLFRSIKIIILKETHVVTNPDDAIEALNVPFAKIKKVML